MTRILVVDDEAAAVAGLQALLELDGYEVVGVDSSRLALQLMAVEPFDAVITDLEMPTVSGMEVVRHAMKARAPVLVVTGYGGTPAAAAAVALGARRVFDKPVDYDALSMELASAVHP